MKKLMMMLLIGMLIIPVVTYGQYQVDIREVTKSIFGIYLGETLQEVRKRFEINNYEEIPGTKGVHKTGFIKRETGRLDFITCVPFEERVFGIAFVYNDASWNNYDTTKKTLKKKYPSTKWVEKRIMDNPYVVIKIFLGSIKLDGIDVNIQVYYKDFVIYPIKDELRLYCTHVSILKCSEREIKH